MKIGHLDNSAKLSGNAVADARKTPVAPGGAAATEASTRVELSAAAAALAAPAPEADFDAEKVARIAQAIRDGRFQVNAEAIADGLIGHTRDLLAAKPQ
jgi:negative regulator of flagellin synthesis FlgM